MSSTRHPWIGRKRAGSNHQINSDRKRMTRSRDSTTLSRTSSDGLRRQRCKNSCRRSAATAKPRARERRSFDFADVVVGMAGRPTEQHDGGKAEEPASWQQDISPDRLPHSLPAHGAEARIPLENGTLAIATRIAITKCDSDRHDGTLGGAHGRAFRFPPTLDFRSDDFRSDGRSKDVQDPKILRERTRSEPTCDEQVI